MLYLGLEKIGRVSSLLLEYVFQSKTVTPTESEQVIFPDNDYNGLSEVTVKAISSTYVGSGVIRQAGKTIIPSSSEQVAVEAGVYTTGQIKVAAAPSGTDISDATLTSGAQMLDGVIGYGAQGKVIGTIPSKQAEIYTPEETEQTISAGQYLAGEQTIAAIPSDYVGSGVTRQGEKTVIPTDTEQIAVESGVYTTGQIKVAAASVGIDTSDATATSTDIVKDKTAYVNGKKVTGSIDEIGSSAKIFYGESELENIQETTKIDGFEFIIKHNIPLLFRRNSRIGLLISGDKFGDATAENVAAGSTFTSSAGVKVAGTMVVQHYYTGEDEPDSSLGNDGDLYLRL